MQDNAEKNKIHDVYVCVPNKICIELGIIIHR